MDTVYQSVLTTHEETVRVLSQREGLKKRWEEVGSLGHCCPTCAQPISAELKQRQLDDLHQQVQEASRALKATQALEQACIKTSDLAKAKEREAWQRLTMEQSNLDRLTMVKPHLPPLEELRTKQTQAETAERNAKLILDEHTASQESAAVTLAQHQERSKALVELEANRGKLAQYQKAVAALETLKGTILGADNAKEFASALNLVWQQFHQDSGWKLDSMGLHLQSDLPTGPVKPADISGGQKVILDAAIRLAAATLTGFTVLALDDSTKLPDEARSKLVRLLAKSGVQVIVCRTSDKPLDAAKQNGLASYHLTSPSTFGPVTCVKQ